MAEYTTETVTSTVHRWIIPASEPWGATSEEIGKAWSAAQSTYRKAHGIPVGEALPGDALRFHLGDEANVIQFQTEEPQS